jgi:hypothetical protein
MDSCGFQHLTQLKTIFLLEAIFIFGDQFGRNGFP